MMIKGVLITILVLNIIILTITLTAQAKGIKLTYKEEGNKIKYIIKIIRVFITFLIVGIFLAIKYYADDVER